eukprot:6179613-Pleurochrysis_carterae.AAC.1
MGTFAPAARRPPPESAPSTARRLSRPRCKSRARPQPEPYANQENDREDQGAACRKRSKDTKAKQRYRVGEMCGYLADLDE